MEFYPSLTINRCHFDRLCEIWADHVPGNKFPFQRAIVSPIFARNGILQRLHAQRLHCKVIFDSGGFHIQQGRIALGSASKLLKRIYGQNKWAYRFTLPDSPITSFDSRETIRRKLLNNRNQYNRFPSEFPDGLRKRMLPVVHATNSKELYASAMAARRVRSKALGFGGFSTSGPNAGVNSLSRQTLPLLLEFLSICREWKLDSHIFGIGGPASIAVLRHLRVSTCDSAGWIRTAAYGNVYVPYIGAVNVTGTASSRRHVCIQELKQLLKATKHSCVFCDQQELLIRSWQYRALHNYCTVCEIIGASDVCSPDETMNWLQRYNPRFATYLEFGLKSDVQSSEGSHPRNLGRSLNKPRRKRNRPRARMTRTLVG